MEYIFHKRLLRSEALLGFTESSEKAVLPVQPVPIRRQFIILVCLNTSPDKLKLIFDFIVRLFTNHAAITSSMGYFSYESYRFLAGQQFFGCLKEPKKNIVFYKIIITIYRKFVSFLSAP
jgi:hypothetical protein